ncbi:MULTISPECIES: alpha/beta hydrolase [unclassified Phyllobacterium]|uniref:alpha/beta hydrolase n=1 Tax=unclassified Phyllobacterium TaxID=2638441 RepID=UPI003012EA40
MKITDTYIQANFGSLAVRTYLHNERTWSPTIILCHGFCGIRDILLPAFAEAFSHAGFNAITFDYRGFGDSSGERGRLIPAEQIQDIDAVVNWSTTQPFVNANQIGLWGTSLGGGHVIEVAARSNVVKCVVSQLAFADGLSLITGDLAQGARIALLDTLEKLYQRKVHSGKDIFVPIPKVLTDKDSTSFFEEIKELYPKVDVKIPFLTVREIVGYAPVAAAESVSQPVLVMAAENDIVNPPSQARRLYDALPGQKSYHLQKDARHYDFYGSPHFETISKIQADWFAHHLTA